MTAVALVTPLCVTLLAAKISVVTTSGVAAYDEALAGFRSAVGAGNSVDIVDLADGATGRDLPGMLAARAPDLIFLIGSQALERMQSIDPGVPVVSAMTLGAQDPPAMQLAGRVDLDIAPELIITELERLMPGKTRIGVIYDPRSFDSTAWRTAGRQKGVVIEMASCATPDHLLATFRGLAGRIDLLVAVPDSTLYNGATVKPLVLASLDRGVPVVGFSASFVRAGAALGIFPDYREMGRQAAELAVRPKGGSTVHQGPRKLVVAANPTVLRLLGVDLRESSRKDVTFLR
jgi:ABC-type uncharacterized transport system substrate-binding protein